jgi:hypothetical protein
VAVAAAAYLAEQLRVHLGDAVYSGRTHNGQVGRVVLGGARAKRANRGRAKHGKVVAARWSAPRPRRAPRPVRLQSTPCVPVCDSNRLCASLSLSLTLSVCVPSSRTICKLLMLTSRASCGLRSPTADSSAEKWITWVMPCSTTSRSRWSGRVASAYAKGPSPSAPAGGARMSDATTRSLPRRSLGTHPSHVH